MRTFFRRRIGSGWNSLLLRFGRPTQGFAPFSLLGDTVDRESNALVREVEGAAYYGEGEPNHLEDYAHCWERRKGSMYAEEKVKDQRYM